MNNFTLAVSAAFLAASVQSYDLDKYSINAEKQVNMPTTNGDYAEIDIETDGVSQKYYVAATFAKTEGDATDYFVPANGRGYITTTPTLDPKNPQYFLPNLKNAAVEWDIDLSQHECGCIAAFYLVSMPGVKSDGSLWMETDGFGY